MSAAAGSSSPLQASRTPDGWKPPPSSEQWLQDHSELQTEEKPPLAPCVSPEAFLLCSGLQGGTPARGAWTDSRAPRPRGGHICRAVRSPVSASPGWGLAARQGRAPGLGGPEDPACDSGLPWRYWDVIPQRLTQVSGEQGPPGLRQKLPRRK